MRRICFVLLLNLLIAPSALAWKPVGGLEELYNLDVLPRLRAGVVQRAFSSYDRSGGNNDGFSGQYSKLREENGNSVIAEMSGAGCIQRLWFTHSAHDKDGLLNHKKEHIKIYLDGAAAPALDVPLEALFDGSLEDFPQPLAGQGIGGFYSYVPIAYRNGCKVVIEGDGVRFYQLNYATFPDADGVETFTLTPSAARREGLQRAAAAWRTPATQWRPDDPRRAILAQTFQITPDAPFVIVAPKQGSATVRPAMIGGIQLAGLSPRQLDQVRVQVRYDDATTPAIDAPASLFFGQTFAPGTYESLFSGGDDKRVYQALPMPFRDQCVLTLSAPVELYGRISMDIYPLELPIERYGYLHAAYHESLPTQPDVLHPFLRVTGKGHYVGTYLSTQGPKDLPYWLEGDDRWFLNDALIIHGTGSEDYFNCGWYALVGRLNGPASLPTHGFPIYGTTEDAMRATAYRWHMADPVPFDGKFEVNIEHGEANKFIADYRSLAFYYRANE